MKDRELLSLILQNIFKIIELLPSGMCKQAVLVNSFNLLHSNSEQLLNYGLIGRRAFTDKILPRFREIFLSPGNAKGPPERDPAKEAGLMVLLENIAIITNNCSGKEFKDGKFYLLGSLGCMLKHTRNSTNHTPGNRVPNAQHRRFVSAELARYLACS
jgi:hypothetical protein